jgi:hypothetical protein
VCLSICVLVRPSNAPVVHAALSVCPPDVQARRFYGGMEAEDIRLSGLNYTAALRFRSEAEARPAFRHFERNAHILFPTQPGSQIRVRRSRVI